MDSLPIKRALFSVTDKTGLLPFASFLASQKVQIISTGGTCKALKEAGIAVTQVSDVTGFPEIMGGRVKTLHPKIHGGILADKSNPQHMEAIAGLGIETFDLICVNLYNFAEAASLQLSLTEAIEQIDIGGPCMLRAAAKNYHSVAVVPSPKWYDTIMKALQENEMKLSLEIRRTLAAETFSKTSGYDQMISTYLQTGKE